MQVGNRENEKVPSALHIDSLSPRSRWRLFLQKNCTSLPAAYVSRWGLKPTRVDKVGGRVHTMGSVAETKSESFNTEKIQETDKLHPRKLKAQISISPLTHFCGIIPLNSESSPHTDTVALEGNMFWWGGQ